MCVWTFQYQEGKSAHLYFPDNPPIAIKSQSNDGLYRGTVCLFDLSLHPHSVFVILNSYWEEYGKTGRNNSLLSLQAISPLLLEQRWCMTFCFALQCFLALIFDRSFWLLLCNTLAFLDNPAQELQNVFCEWQEVINHHRGFIVGDIFLKCGILCLLTLSFFCHFTAVSPEDHSAVLCSLPDFGLLWVILYGEWYVIIKPLLAATDLAKNPFLQNHRLERCYP